MLEDARRPVLSGIVTMTLLPLGLAACGGSQSSAADSRGEGASPPAATSPFSAARARPSTRPAPASWITNATLALPEELRAGAMVLQATDDGMVRLREGTNGMICLADDPGTEGFRVSCYHESLDPLMARGRELRAEGVTGQAVDSVRFAEIERGELTMPAHPAALYTLIDPAGAPSDPGAELGPEARRLYVLYVSGAEADELGLPTEATRGVPWLMQPGTPKAHVMFLP